MGDLFGSYEHTFGTLTAEITSKIGRIPSLESGENLKSNFYFTNLSSSLSMCKYIEIDITVWNKY